MQERALNVQGAVVYWNAGPTRADQIAGRLAALGMDKFIPKPRTNESALLYVLGEYCRQWRGENALHVKAGDDRIVQKRRNRKDGFEIVAVKRGKPNVYTPIYAVVADEYGFLSGETCRDSWQYAIPDMDTLREQFNYHKRIVTGAAAGQSLVAILASLGGVALRPSGGIYWIPQDAIETWANVAGAFENSAETTGGTTCYQLATVMDDNTLRAVRDSLLEEVTKTCTRIVEELDGLGQEAIENRKAALFALHEKIEHYESLFSTGLESLHNVVKVVESRATLTMLQSVGL
jgi:hypothetical protein